MTGFDLIGPKRITDQGINDQLFEVQVLTCEQV